MVVVVVVVVVNLIQSTVIRSVTKKHVENDDEEPEKFKTNHETKWKLKKKLFFLDSSTIKRKTKSRKKKVKKGNKQIYLN